jgi:hypothetical protein
MMRGGSAIVNACGHRSATRYEGLACWDFNWLKGGGATGPRRRAHIDSSLDLGGETAKSQPIRRSEGAHEDDCDTAPDGWMCLLRDTALFC